MPIGTELIQAYEGGEPVGLATVVNVPNGSDGLGAKLLLRSDGSTSGSLGSAVLDTRAIETARQVADVGNVESFITEDGIEVFVEGFTTPPTLVMIGGY